MKTESGISYRFYRPSKLASTKKHRLLSEIEAVTTKAWGKFDRNFIDEHVFRQTERIVVAVSKGVVIGYCASENKRISGRKVGYVEFTVVDPIYQGMGIGPKLTYLCMRRMFFSNIFSFMFAGVYVVFLTPNIRALSKMAQVASCVYPNPYAADPESGKVEPADDVTWNMAREIIEKSWDPGRVLDREGLVLHGSYRSLPGLVYDQSTAPWHSSSIINKFAERYLRYSNSADREFVVIARVTLGSLLRNYI